MKFMTGWGWSCITTNPYLHSHIAFQSQFVIWSSPRTHDHYLLLEHIDIALIDSNLVVESQILSKNVRQEQERLRHRYRISEEIKT